MNTSELQQNLLTSSENACMEETPSYSHADIQIQAEEFLGNLARRNYSENSVESYRYALGYFTAFLSARGKLAVLEITARDIADYRLSLVERRMKQNSVYAYLRVVRLFCRRLMERDRLFVDPSAGMEIPGPDRKLQAVPTEEEVRKLMALPDTGTPEGIRDRAVLESLYSTAARREEMGTMDVKDVDLAGRTIRIMGKGKRERLAPLGKEAAHWLKLYLKEVRDELRAEPAEPALWLNNSGTRLSGQLLITLVRRYAMSCEGITTHITTHSLRRACATHMLRRGANPLEIQMLLGHSDLSHLRNYLRLSIRDLKAAHEKTRLAE